jgi:hypothetical protein
MTGDSKDWPGQRACALPGSAPRLLEARDTGPVRPSALVNVAMEHQARRSLCRRRIISGTTRYRPSAGELEK